ncbi:hypothetical protein [Brucella pituitosa]|uniref:hypothetical protein n=1 Tax=Brucella pituitosa TaxID=571256 RepID=UPI0020935F70|nr:hypothetical protein [Brucella pituitosa]
MAMLLRVAMEEFLSDWSTDLPEPWRALLGHVALDFDGIASELELEVWEPIFPFVVENIFRECLLEPIAYALSTEFLQTT